MRRRLLATIALVGALIGSVLLGAGSAQAALVGDDDGADRGVGSSLNRGW
jgi:hypothetical protein